VVYGGIMSITIHLLEKKDAAELLAFETENRSFFESMVPPRNPEYYNLEKLRAIITELEDEQKDDLCYLYLVRNEEGEVVGRVNLFSVVRGPFQKVEIGYRIGMRHNSKGYATKAIELVCKEAFETHGFNRIEAGTSTRNIGSQIALIKNKFEFVGRQRKVIKINDQWEDGILFECLVSFD